MSKPRVIAFYLPQYHPTPDNDKWWGKGFTEWTNVGKAKPLFRGHYQPRVPADLGYYDLRIPEVREAQAQLAREAGIEGFCYYHYWFGNGKQELELPFNEVLKSGEPDFPFMLCWANESWHKKFWNKDGHGTSKEVLAEQLYPGEDDMINHFNSVLPAFKDPRYIKVDDKPAFMIYKPLDIPDVEKFIEKWNMLAKENGLKGIHFIASIWSNVNNTTIPDLRAKGFDAVNTYGFWNSLKKNDSLFQKVCRRLFKVLFNHPRIVNYKKISDDLFFDFDSMENIYPTLLPNWDHSPRSGANAIVLTDSSPKNFKAQVKRLLKITENKNNNIIILKSWNEWGEGNYIEPDIKYGKKYIMALREAIDEK